MLTDLEHDDGRLLSSVMEAVQTSETSVNLHQSTRRYKQ
jgi:hypothetical protein